jgi:hypothetical protein
MVRYPKMRNIERWANLAEAKAHNKRAFLTSDEQNSTIGSAALTAARNPAFDRAAGVRARRFATKLSPRGARSVRLTADGERYFEKVSAALAALQDASRDMLRHRRDTNAELWISSLPFFTSAVLIPALPEFKRRNPHLTLRIEATHQYADFNASRVDVAIRYGREHSTGLKFEPLVAVKGLPVCAPALVKAGLRRPEDLSQQVLIHLTTQPRLAGLAARGRASTIKRARPSLARQCAGDAGGRRTGAWRHIGDVAADQGTTGLRQKTGRTVCVRGRA